MSYNPEKGDLSGTEFIEKVIGYLPKSAYNKYEDDELDSNTEIWLMGGKKKFQECHVFVKNKQLMTRCSLSFRFMAILQ
jgi:hypothetical protein